MKKVKNIITNINKINEKYSNWSKKKPQNVLLQFFPRNIFLLILFITLVSLFIPKLINNYMLEYCTKDFTGYHDEFVDKSVEQKISKKVKKIDKLGIVFGTYKRTNNSIYKLELFEDNKVIYSKKFNTKNLIDNKPYDFDVYSGKLDSNKKYKFVITPIKVDKNNAVTIAMNKKELYHRITRNSTFYNETLVISSIFLIAFFVINYLINNGKIKTEKKFLLLMLIYIIPITFINPAYEVPDEMFHFIKALRLSQYQITKTPYENMVKRKIEMPKNFDCLSYSNIQYNQSNYINRKDFLNCFNSTKNKHTIFIKIEPNKLVSYIPAAVAIKIVDLFSNSPMLLFFAGRLATLLTAILILLYALKITPKHKRLLLTVVLIPVFIQQMISYSYDSILNALCILATAYLIKFYNSKEPITKKEYIILILIAALILDIKEPYILVMAPLLFLDKKKFGDKKYDKLKKVLLIGTAVLGCCILLRYLPSIGTPITKAKAVYNPRGNSASSILFHPKYLLRTVYNTLTIHGISYLEGMIGSFGWLTKKADLILIYSYLIFMILLTMSEESKVKRKDRIINLITLFILIAGGVFFAMYIIWTPRGADVIDGVQGRYFLSALLLLLITLIPKKKLLKIKDETVYQFLNISTVAYLITLLIVFY